ncbi:MAG: hypothetical protein CML20_20495 [Rheinheimera sp.]|jgi:hypothetical protein|nr:hypothetical protein [Rheinheimera sp.]|tara:strand:+ start:9639 stop:9824 length:186 start_codon:yes stop_codon:yes gene_type:complete
MTKHQRYEQRKKAQGLKKITLWIPTDSEIELKSMAEFCCENKNHIPFMARSLTTGRMCKAI